MYDELTTDLRRAANTWLAEEYKVCAEAVRYLLKESADAIEELLAERDEVNADSWKTAFEVERDEHRWIPVTERLPEKTNHYLVHVKCGCGGEIVSAWEQVAWFCEKFYWEHQHGDDIFEETITHWMPLPEPPKEGLA